MQQFQATQQQGWNQPAVMPPAMPPGYQPSPQQQSPIQQPAPLPNVNPRQLVPHGDLQWPQELWGKPIGEALQYYKIMREDFLRRKREEQEAARQGLRGEPQVQQQQQPGFQPALPGQPQPGWRQPQQQGQQSYIPPQQQAPQADSTQTMEQTIRRVLGEVLPQLMAPVHKVSAEQTFQQVKREFADWNQYHTYILQALQGASEEQLSDPELWRNAYYAVKGRLLSQIGGQPSYGGQQLDFDQPQGQQGWHQPGTPIQTEAPAWDFVEAPSSQPGQGGGNGGGSVMQDPRAIQIARKFGIPLQEYADHWGGRVPPPRQNGQQQPQQQLPPQRFGGG